VVNGGFETGSLQGWTARTGGMGVALPQVSTFTAGVSGGSFSASLGGTTSAGGAPSGDSCLYQDVSAGGVHKLTFSYAVVVAGAAGASASGVEAYLRPIGLNGCAELGTLVFKGSARTTGWQTVTLTYAGPVQIYFDAHVKGSTNVPILYVDNVGVS
jgi:hypothetical protein